MKWVINRAIVPRNCIQFSAVTNRSDHGPINSWDRVPFWVDTTDSFIPLENVIQKNFIMANYRAMGAVDNDDGTA